MAWPLRIVAAASLVGPALLFAYTAWSSHREIDERATERIERALDVTQEHALKVLQTVERTIAETNEVLRGADDEAIRANEERLHLRLRRTHDALPQIQSIWAFDAAGRPLVSSTVLPAPPTLDNSDRDYFRAQAGSDAGLYIGDVVQSRVGSYTFFVVSGRRTERPDGRFNGVVGITVLPEHFRRYYARLANGVADSLGLIRADGSFLARYPEVLDKPQRLNDQSGFVRGIARSPEAGLFTAVSQIDGIERRIGYRRVPGYPVYVQAGVETGNLARELRQTLLGHLAFGLPATLALLALALYALQRSERFEAEVARREAAEAALKQAQRLEAVGQLTGGVAHDFNNLLMVVNGNVERLRAYPAADERQRRAIEAIATAAQRGASLTRQLLSFSRRQTHEPEVIDVARQLAGVEAMLRSSLRGDIAIAVHASEGLWPVKVDLSELELALLNLAVNARDAMPEGGRLTISARNVTLGDPAIIGLTGNFVALSLADTGAGIPPDVLARVFEPFFTTKEVGKGTGLGLSQVYGFARQSGGAATIASRPGQGATVTLYLPRTLEAPAETSPLAAERIASAKPGERGRVLLVEDNPDVAEVSRGNLEALGFMVLQAGDVRSAIALLDRSEGVDLVFSDIVMPGELNGLDFARAVRARPGPRIPVLLATGYSDVAQAAADEGFPILRKPYDTAQLKEMIARAIRATRLKAVEGGRFRETGTG